MSIDAIFTLARETFARAEWVALFLGLTGFYWLFLAWQGVRQGHTRGFGWGEREWTAADARFAGRIWALVGAPLLAIAVLVWILKT